MEITRKTNNPDVVEFAMVDAKDTFDPCTPGTRGISKTCMRLDHCYKIQGGDANAVDLETGQLLFFDPGTKVLKIKVVAERQ